MWFILSVRLPTTLPLTLPTGKLSPSLLCFHYCQNISSIMRIAALRMILVQDNLAGHKSHNFVQWCFNQGIALLYTPLGGSWLNMTESVQGIIQRRALEGEHPTNPQQIIDWLEAAARGWNKNPTPFVWGGKRAARRDRARKRRQALAGSGACVRRIRIRTNIIKRARACRNSQSEVSWFAPIALQQHFVVGLEYHHMQWLEQRA
jgi:hypothetical protein